MKTAALLLSAILLFLTSCGKPSHESIANEMMDHMKEAGDAFATAKDAASAKTAAEKVRKAADKLEAIGAKLKDMSPPSESVKADIEKKMKARGEEMMGSMFNSMAAMATLDADSQKAIKDAQEYFGKKIQALEPEFERHYKTATK